MHSQYRPQEPVKLAVAIIALCGNDRVLMVRNAKRDHSIEIPGGAMRSNESVIQGAARELHEECGLNVELWDLVPFHQKDERGWHVHVVRATIWTGTLRPGGDASGCFFGEPELLLSGQRPEDYETVRRAIDWRAAAGWR